MWAVHPKQGEFIDSVAKRKVVRAGRRGGKTVGMAVLAVKAFVRGRRVLYAAPTNDQVSRFWTEVKGMLSVAIYSKAVRVNETEHVIEIRGTEARIRAKTAWNADSLRGDYADLLILDEFQLMDETAWSEVGAPMLLDNNGDAVFVYTPPSLKTRSASKAKDPQHAAKLWKSASADKSGRWACFHFGSRDNPHLSVEALDEIAKDMSSLAYRQEILAEDVEEAPGALWTRSTIEGGRVAAVPDGGLKRVVVAVDPSISFGGDMAGIVVQGQGHDNHLYVIGDRSVQASPKGWAMAAVNAYHEFRANKIVAEKNQGGEMVALTIATVDPSIPVELVWASRGKEIRAEPVSAVYEHGRAHHVGAYPALEDEMCLAGGTRVTTDRGEVAIMHIRPGDRVLTRSGFREVLRSGCTSPAARVLRITTRGGRCLLATHGHPLYSPAKGRFVPARDMKEGSWVSILADSRPSPPTPTTAPVGVLGDIIGSIEEIEEPIPVYNLFVAGEHEYFANGILVHNCLWTPGEGESPNRMDALVWGATWLLGFKQGQTQLEELLNKCVV